MNILITFYGDFFMTSELLILTPSAVVLAADSKVTVDNRKTFDGVNKLFMLSNNPPMGIMTYNLATFLNIPLETIIKEFRKQLDSSIKSLNDIKKNFEIFFKKIVESSTFKKSFEEKLDIFINLVYNDFKELNKEEYVRIINNSSLNVENLKQCNDEIFSKLNKNKNKFDKIIPEDIKEKDKEEFLLKLNYLFINRTFLEDYTGIVIAGFEDGKLLPSAVNFKITYLYDDKFSIFDFQKDIISEKKVILKPFAQWDMIYTFLNSIDVNTEHKIIDYFNVINNNYLDELKKYIENNNKINGKDEKEVLKVINKIKNENKDLNTAFEEFINEIKKEEGTPILESIASLSKEELSNLAESLIKITSLKNKVQMELETVGGPVDVAIITKGDGFIWTKRKHYFKPEFNPQFFDRKNI